jgi:pyruvate ferredoxin oxidoreductase delta subunit
MKLIIKTVAKPGSTRANKTGAWRSFMPVFDRKLCSKCGICANECPKKAILMVLEGK